MDFIRFALIGKTCGVFVFFIVILCNVLMKKISYAKVVHIGTSTPQFTRDFCMPICILYARSRTSE